MRLYAFLGEGAVAPLSEFRWPVPTDGVGRWVEAGIDAPADAVRGCREAELPWWLDDELWELELEGLLVPDGRCVLASRGRLRRRIDSWTAETARLFTDACAARVRDAAVGALRSAGAESDAALLAAAEGSELERIGAEAGAGGTDDGSRLAGFASDVVLYARDAARPAAGASVGAYVAAHALAGGNRIVRTYAARFEDERRWQVEWLKEHLRL